MPRSQLFFLLWAAFVAVVSLMVFTVASAVTSSASSAPSVLSFGPARLDIDWDGVSFSKAEIVPTCSDTAASYAVTVTQVAGTTDVLWQSPGSTFTNAIFQGMPWYYMNTATVFYNNFALGTTVSPTGVVSFQLSGSTAWTAASSFPGSRETGYLPTTAPMYYTYNMTKTEGTAVELIAIGKIRRLLQSPWSSASPVSSGAVEASGSRCF